MNKKVDLIKIESDIVRMYLEGSSSYRIADFFSVSATAVKRLLKDKRVLRTQKQAQQQRDNSNYKNKVVSEKTRAIMSDLAKTRTGNKNSFFGKKHSKDVKDKLSKIAKDRQGKLNPNYRHGKNIRRPRDFKTGEFTPIRKFIFNRDNYTCVISGQKGGHLHAHHLLPFWVMPEAFLDVDNLITVSTSCHFKICHNENWQSFNVDLIPDSLLEKYSLHRERLNELAASFNKK
jgi:predicted transcriptional regulator